MTKIPNFENSR